MASNENVAVGYLEEGEHAPGYYVGLYKTWAFLTFVIGFPIFIGIYLDQMYFIKAYNFIPGTVGGTTIVSVSFLMWFFFGDR